MIYRQNPVFKTMFFLLVFSLIAKSVTEPPSHLSGKFHYFFFEPFPHGEKEMI